MHLEAQVLHPIDATPDVRLARRTEPRGDFRIAPLLPLKAGLADARSPVGV